MKSAIYTTQLTIPQLPQNTIRRNRLIDMLENGLAFARLAHISAPAGYGKTTFLAQWAQASQFLTAWISLSEAENDPERFIRYLYQAWERVQPGIQDHDIGLILEGPLQDIHVVLPALIEHANQTEVQIVFILDDYHLIQNPAVHEMLGNLIDYLPNSIRFILSSRGVPDLPLARYRARGTLLEMRMDDLQFNLDETEDFFRTAAEDDVDKEALRAIHARLEGWAAGLRMFALSMRQRRLDDSIPHITGKHRFIADYLRQDVFSALPEDNRQFVLETSILDRLSAPLCDAVTGRTDSYEMLETLEASNVFLVALDHNREWYRYHALFSDFLREELSRQASNQIPELHRRAAQWFLANDFPEQCYQHSLLANDRNLMVELFDRYANAKLQVGELRVIKRWLEGLPPDWFDAYPALGLAWAGYFAFTGAFEACLRKIHEIEMKLLPSQTPEQRQQLARVKTVRCFIACISNDLPKAESYAEQALNELPKDDVGYMPGIYAALGDTYRQNGLWEKAYRSYLKALEFTQSPAVQGSSAHIYGAIADLSLLQGRLRSAAQYWQKALASMQDRDNWGRLALPVTGWIYIRTAELLYEWNQLEEAGDHLARGLERAVLGGDIRTQAAGNVLSARLFLARGALDQADGAMDTARHLLEQARFPQWTAQFDRCQVERWLAENRVRDAMAWYKNTIHTEAAADHLEGDAANITAARVLTATGDPSSLEQALRLITAVYEDAESSGRGRTAVEALAIQALALRQKNDLPGALAALERALRKAEPEGYVRLFADLGLPMAELLQEIRARGIMQEYADRLLEALQVDYASLPGSGQTLPEPLTAREYEILQLLSAGLSNREIAERFVLSPETVKKHVSSIVGKLGASNRTEAAARARTLGLLD